MLRDDFGRQEFLTVEPVQEDVAIRNGTEELTYAARRRLEVLQKLNSYKGTTKYKEEKIKACEELKVSERSLRRMILQYKQEGLEGIMTLPRKSGHSRRV